MAKNLLSLQTRLDQAAERTPRQIAVEESRGASISYGDLAILSDRLRDRLVAMGVRRGDRVGIVLYKSIDSVAAIYGVLKVGAAYVPVDPAAPAARNGFLLSNCRVRIVIVEATLAEALRVGIAAHGEVPTMLELDGTSGSDALCSALDHADQKAPASVMATDLPSGDQLAYILYTSGSTG